MKTLLRRLSLVAAGFAMALGVGVAIGNAPKAVETQATGPYDDYVAVTDLDDINSYTLYALGNAAGTSFAQNAVSSSKIAVTSDGTNVGFFRLEGADGGYNLRFVAGSSFPYVSGSLVNNASDANLKTSGDPSIWEPFEDAEKLALRNKSYQNRVLAESDSAIKAYASSTSNPKYYLYSTPTDTLTSIAALGQTTSFDDGSLFSFGGSVTATYSISGTSGHVGITSDLTFKFKASGAAEFSEVPATLTAAHNGGTIQVTYTDAWGKTAATSYVISVGAEAITSIALDKDSATLYLGVAGHNSTQIAVTGYGKIGDPTEGVTWESDDDEIATVVNGVVTATGIGETNIIARSVFTPSTTATCTITVISDSLTGNLSWSDRGTIDCIEGTKLCDAVKYVSWAFNGTYASHADFDATSWRYVGTESGKIHLGLYDNSLPASEGAALPLDYAFQAADNGKYLVAYYLGSRTITNRVITVTPRLNTMAATGYNQTTLNMVSVANVTESGIDGGGAESFASASRYGFTISATNGYFAGSEWKVYPGSELTFASTCGKKIVSVQMTFTSSETGGLLATETINAMSKTFDLGSRARIKTLTITYEEPDYANHNLAAQKAVIQFANSMNSIMAVPGVCGTEGNYGHDDPSTFQTAWSNVKSQYTTIIGTLAGDDLEAAEGMFAHAEAKWDDNPDCLQRAMKTYDFVLSHYASELVGIDGYEFLNGIRSLAGAAKINSPYVINESLNPAILVALLGGLSVALVGGYFFIRRRKESE